MLTYNQAIKQEKSYQGLQMSEINPVMKLIFKQTFVNLFGKNVWKLVKILILHLMELKRCTY